MAARGFFFGRIRRALREVNALSPQHQRVIRRNMREGLLCACNARKVPYFGHPLACDDNGHGYAWDESTRMLHGYDDCVRED